MITRHQNAAIPAVARHHDQVVEQLHTLGGDGKVHRAIGGHFRNLGWCALIHVQADVRVFAHKALNHARQGISSLGVRRGNGQRAFGFIAELLRNLFDAVHLTEDFTGNFQDGLTGWCHAGQVLAAAGKNLNTKLVFQQANLLADTGL